MTEQRTSKDLVTELRADHTPQFEEQSPAAALEDYRSERRQAANEIERLQQRVAELKVAYDRMFDKAVELERIAADTRYAAEDRVRMIQDGAAHEPECPYCKKPADSDGSIFHAGGCRGLDDIKMTRLQYDSLVARTAQPPRIRRVVREELAKTSAPAVQVEEKDFDRERREALKSELWEVQCKLTGINDELKRLQQDRCIAIARVTHLQAQITVLNQQIAERSEGKTPALPNEVTK